VLPFQDESASLLDLRISEPPVKTPSISMSTLTQVALCVAKLGLIKKCGNCSPLESALTMLSNSSKRAAVVFKEKFTVDILSVEADFEYAHACFTLLLARFTQNQ